MPKDKTIALFVDAFGDINSNSPLSLGYEALALQLSQEGYDVTVVYTGINTNAFSAVASRFMEKKISLQRYVKIP
jgi:hypothetical protein